VIAVSFSIGCSRLATVPYHRTMSATTSREPAPRVRQRVLPALRRLPGLARAEVRFRGWLLRRNLRRLNDVVARTPLAGRYWIFCGVLLGWAREGKLLAHDFRDADLAYDDADHDRFLAAVPAIVEAGFTPAFRFRSNDGEVTEHSFVRQGAKFEFFRLARRDDQYRYYVYARDPEREGGHLELLGAVPAQPLEPIEFLDRTWLKPVDHELELHAMYGDWRTPDPGWSFLDDRAIIDRRVWHETDYDWDYDE